MWGKSRGKLFLLRFAVPLVCAVSLGTPMIASAAHIERGASHADHQASKNSDHNDSAHSNHDGSTQSDHNGSTQSGDKGSTQPVDNGSSVRHHESDNSSGSRHHDESQNVTIGGATAPGEARSTVPPAKQSPPRPAVQVGLLALTASASARAGSLPSSTSPLVAGLPVFQPGTAVPAVPPPGTPAPVVIGSGGVVGVAPVQISIAPDWAPLILVGVLLVLVVLSLVLTSRRRRRPDLPPDPPIAGYLQ